MSGHSKFNNIKHKKARQDFARAREFLKLSEKLRYLISQKKIDLAEALSLTRKHGFIKKKVLNIWEKCLEEPKKKGEENLHRLYQAPFEVMIYAEGERRSLLEWEIKNQLKKIESSILSNYFRKFNEWKIREKQFNLEEYLLSSLQGGWIYKIEEIKYKNKEIIIIFLEKQFGEILKNLFVDYEIIKKIIWRPSFFIVEKEAREYVKKLIKSIEDKKIEIYSNVDLNN